MHSHSILKPRQQTRPRGSRPWDGVLISTWPPTSFLTHADRKVTMDAKSYAAMIHVFGARLKGAGAPSGRPTTVSGQGRVLESLPKGTRAAPMSAPAGSWEGGSISARTGRPLAPLPAASYSRAQTARGLSSVGL